MTAHPNLIGGAWLRGTPVPNVNPSDLEDVIGHYDHATGDQARAAVAAASDAFPIWSRCGVQARAELLDRIARGVFDRRDALADLLAREEGKTRREAYGEVDRAGNIFRFFAGEALRCGGDWLPSVREGVEVTVCREPLGVVAAITPWNFPLAIPAWKVAPALAYGDCVVLKPAELTPGCAWALAEIIEAAGCPPGVFNLVMGRGAQLGDALIDTGVDAVSFTGSTGTGRSILQRAAARGIKVQLEMGGKNPLVVLDDADLDLAVAAALDGAFYATGQRCTASSRLIVQEAIHDRFVAGLIAALERQVVGNARAPDTTIGPVVDSRQLRTDLDHIEGAKAEGAHLAWGGRQIEGRTPGYYLQPALFTGTHGAMRINREEVFGPVANVVEVADYDAALAAANDTEFGLCAGICTKSLKHAAHFRRNAQAGMVMVNLPTAGVDHHVAFGGRKGSSYGPREQGAYAREFYTTVKTAYVRAE